MGKFDFRLRFNLPESHRINSDAREFELFITPVGQRIYLTGAKFGSAIKEYGRAAVRGGPFDSEQEALAAAERSKRALLFWAVKQRAGIDFGDGRQRGMATEYGLKMLEERVGVPVRNDIHGVDVFESVKNVRFAHLSATAQIGMYPPTLSEVFAREYSANRQATAKQILASEIYASSFFDISQRSRFITLVTAVESLLELSKRPGSTQALVDEFQAKTLEAAIDDATKASINGSLERLRYASIGQAGRALVDSLLPGKAYAGESASAFFSSCYDMRSKIVHNGTAGQNVDVSQLASNMEEFVANLLIASLNAAAE